MYINAAVACEPNASFTYNQSSPYFLSVDFTNTTSNTPSTYNWAYQDNQGNVINFSTDENPTYTFPSSGIYAITLTATNFCGSDDFIQFIDIDCDDPIADFTINSQAEPQDMTITFQNNSIGANNYSWNYGDGTTGTQDSHTYGNPGTYYVCLTAFNDCSDDTYCQNVTVVCELPNTYFSEPQQSNPSDPSIFVSMSPSYVGSDSHVWDMGDGSTYTSLGASHTYTSAGTYNICLTAYNACGPETYCRSVTITCDIPSADFTPTPNVNQSPVFGHIYYFDVEDGGGTFDFGDGNTAIVGYAGNTTYHTYEDIGVYNVCYTNGNSCGSDVICYEIYVNCIPPVSNFTYTQNDPYYPLINFTQTSTPNEPPSAPGSPTYSWDIEGINYTTANPAHIFSGAGEYTVSLTTINTCDYRTTTQTITVQCLDPTADFTYAIDENDSYTINFSDLSLGVDHPYYWDLGDGNTSSFENDFSYSYNTEGTYTVCLSVSNNCGSDQYCMNIEISSNPCTPPSVYNAVPTSTTSALTTWEAVSDATFYQVKYRRKGTSPWLTVGTASLQRNLPNLSPNKYHQYKMRSQCSDGSWSDFTEIKEFYTSTCEIPVGIASIYLDQTRVRIRWDANANTYKNIVRYREIGTATWLVKGNTPGNNFIYITGLNSNANYEYRVRARCNDDTFSAYSDKYFFSTNPNNQVRLMNEEENNINQINIYPNPIREQLNINYSSATESETIISIMNISGKTVQQQITDVNQGANTLQMNTSSLPKGYYIISIQNNGQVHSQKFIKS